MTRVGEAVNCGLPIVVRGMQRSGTVVHAGVRRIDLRMTHESPAIAQ